MFRFIVRCRDCQGPGTVAGVWGRALRHVQLLPPVWCLENAAEGDLFEDALQKARAWYRFDVVGYVVMPEHVHLLVSEPGRELLSVALQGLKLSVARRSKMSPFWLPRYYDFNVRTDAKRLEKLNYIHWNPMKGD